MPGAPGRGPEGGPFAALHGTWVTADGQGHYVTHDQIRGAVVHVSATSLTVRAEDGFTATYAVTKDTVVLVRPRDDDPPAPSGS